MFRILFILILLFPLAGHAIDASAEAGDEVTAERDVSSATTTSWPNGTPKSYEPMANGRREGTSRYYDESGAVTAERQFRDGREHGVSRWYFPSGRLKAEIHYAQGLPEGEAQWFDEQGQMNSAGVFHAGRFVPSWYGGENSEHETVPWLTLALMVLLSLLPLPLLFRRPAVSAVERSYAAFAFFLIQGGALVIAGLMGLVWMGTAPIHATVWLIGACSFFLLGGFGFLVFSFIELRKSGLAERPEVNRAPFELITSDVSVWPAPHLLANYRRQMILGAFAALVLAGVGPALAYFGGVLASPELQLPLPPPELSPLSTRGAFAWSICFLALGWGWLGIRARLRERELCVRCHGRELLFSPDGLRAAIGLWDRRTRREMRRGSREAWLVAWGEIESFTWSGRIFRVTLKGQSRQLSLRASAFPGKEEEITRLAQKYLGTEESSARVSAGNKGDV